MTFGINKVFASKNRLLLSNFLIHTSPIGFGFKEQELTFVENYFSAIIEMYGPQLIKMVEANLQPDAVCGAVGLCDGFIKTLPERCAEPKKTGLCRAFFECESVL